MERLLSHLDRALRGAMAVAGPPQRPSPGADVAEPQLSDAERRQSASLMRVNHCGEVCAQALYHGQALTARQAATRAEMEQAAEEEADHLAWCAERLAQLDDRPSVLNPLFYGLSFAVGAAAGLVSDRLSLGFVAATEDQVCQHLRGHLERLPPGDGRSRAIVRQMLEDEERHGHAALEAGGHEFPPPVRRAMTALSGVMTQTAARI